MTAHKPSVCVSEFHLQNGKHDEAWMILKQVHDTNMRAKGYPERVFSVSHKNTFLFSMEVSLMSSICSACNKILTAHFGS